MIILNLSQFLTANNNACGSGLDGLDDLFGSMGLGSRTVGGGSNNVSNKPSVPPLLSSDDGARLQVGARLFIYTNCRKDLVQHINKQKKF